MSGLELNKTTPQVEIAFRLLLRNMLLSDARQVFIALFGKRQAVAVSLD